MTTRNDGNFSSAELTNLDARVSELSALQVQKNAMYAREAQLIHEVTQLAVEVQERTRASRQADELPYRTVAAELGAAFRISDRSAQRMMSEADTLVTRFSGTFKSLAAGRISQAHVRVLIDAGAHITDAQARADFETAALPVAERESASRLRPFARLLAERIHPRSLTERHEAAAEERAVRVVDLPDGMAELIATLPTAIAYAAFDRLSAMARAVTRAIVAEAKEALGRKEALRAEEAEEVLGGKEALGAEEALGAKGSPALDVSAAVVPDTRSTDQLRADILADLLLSGAPEAHGAAGFGAIRAHVQVVVPVLALLGQSEEPATLVGVGAIDADTARRLAGSAKGWDRVLTHPITGAVLATDRYRPGKQLKRALQIRDQHCRFPGCRIAVRRCDIDHTTDFALGGQTTDCNLAHLCKRHHTLKHESAWAVVQQPGGVLKWTSPTGRVYPDLPTSQLLFQPVPPRRVRFDPAPF